MAEGITIPEEELDWRFGPSGGPGGQHANRSSTRAELLFSLTDTRVLSDAQKQLLRERLESRLKSGLLVVTADDTRSQARNREIARQRLADLLAGALVERVPRVATKPTKAARRRRVDQKKARSRTKA